MMLPAYAMDAAPIAYEAQLQTMDGLSAGAMRGSTATRRRPYRAVVSPNTEPRYIVASASSGPAADAATPNDAVAGRDSIADTVTPPAASVQRRAQLARIAFGCGWLFLGIALFCFAQSFSVVGSWRGLRLWRPIQVHS
ncbi:MAG: hypothetical protein JWR16_2141 [Nevskia sp.]|nr:hypothetical protein [Nevskia sp.]